MVFWALLVSLIYFERDSSAEIRLYEQRAAAAVEIESDLIGLDKASIATWAETAYGEDLDLLRGPANPFDPPGTLGPYRTLDGGSALSVACSQFESYVNPGRVSSSGWNAGSGCPYTCEVGVFASGSLELVELSCLYYNSAIGRDVEERFFAKEWAKSGYKPRWYR